MGVKVTQVRRIQDFHKLWLKNDNHSDFSGTDFSGTENSSTVEQTSVHKNYTIIFVKRGFLLSCFYQKI